MDGCMDEQTRTVAIGKSLSTSRALCWKFNSCEKSMQCRTHIKTYDYIKLKHSLLFRGQPSPFQSTMENTIVTHLT